MTDNVFDAATTASTAPEPDKGLTGDAKRLADKDSFITQLKAELETARAAAAAVDETKNTLEELRAEFRAMTSSTGSTETTRAAPDEQTIQRVVLESMQELEVKRDRERNQNTVNDMLVKKYGDSAKAKDAVTNLAASLGVPAAYLADVAARSPSAFFKLVGIDTVAPPRTLDTNKSALNSTAEYTPADSTPGTKAYFENLRRTDPSRYWSVAVQKQVHEASARGDGYLKP
jgi:hypothetical protein